jgi:tRNA(fMet)-specific endonuclease VapC
MIRYLLDSDICIDLLKGRNALLDARLARCVPGEVGVAAITIFELSYGAHKSLRVMQNRAALAAFFLPLVSVPCDEQAAILAGELRVLLERAGTPIGPNDLLIAAQAVALGVSLVTNNEREFRRVPGLQIENWTK